MMAKSQLQKEWEKARQDTLVFDYLLNCRALFPQLLAALVEIAELTKRQQLPLTAQINDLASAMIAKAKELEL